MALSIFYSHQNDKDMKSVNPKITKKEIETVEGWVGDLQSKQKTLTAKTKYSMESGTGETLKEVGQKDGLRIDLQKVIGVGKSESAATYIFLKSRKPATAEDFEAAQVNPKSAKVPRVLEIAGKTTFQALWSLFAVQKVKTYNRVFHLNNLIDELTVEQWKRIFRTTLQGACTAIVTNDRNKIPSGYDAEHLEADEG
jgi:hypothetical protein